MKNPPLFRCAMLLRIAPFLLSAFVLAGCGGADDGASGDPPPAVTPDPTTPTPGTPATPVVLTGIDKYHGAWAKCLPEGSGSVRESLQVTKTSDTTAAMQWFTQRYTATDCSGVGEGGTGSPLRATLVSSTTVDGQAIDRFTLHIRSSSASWTALFALLPDGRLRTASDSDAGPASFPDGLAPGSFSRWPTSDTRPSSTPIDAYVGRWRLGCLTVAFTRRSESELGWVQIASLQKCGGWMHEGRYADSGTARRTGSKLVNGQPVDTFEIPTSSTFLGEGTDRQLAAIAADGTLRLGMRDAQAAVNFDPEGYPGDLNAPMARLQDGPDTAAPVATGSWSDPYLGYWSRCEAAATGSLRRALLVELSGELFASLRWSVTTYGPAGCTGAVLARSAGTDVVFTEGATVVEGRAAQRLRVQAGGSFIEERKTLITLRADGQLAFGRMAADGGAVDAQGYPTTLEALPFTRWTTSDRLLGAAHIDRMIGSWKRGCLTLTFTKEQDLVNRFVMDRPSTCAGWLAGTPIGNAGTVTLTGRKWLDGELVDTLDVLMPPSGRLPNPRGPQVAVIRPDGRLYIGAIDALAADFDPEGYQGVLETEGLVRQP